jgi:hypothetical protein
MNNLMTDIDAGAVMSVKMQWWKQVLESEEMSEAGKLRAARTLHLLEFPDDVEQDAEGAGDE